MLKQNDTITNRLKTGMELKKEYVVERQDTAKCIGSGGLEVLATPALIGWIENAAYEMAGLCLLDEFTTVGSNVNINHIAPTPVGMKVRVKVSLKEIDNRKLTFEVEAQDECQKVAVGLHHRVIVEKNRFMAKVLQKLEQ